jgi:putative addiction module component (TIGR02574 family)
MPEVVERLKSQMAGLPANERAELALFLIRSLDAEEDVDAEAAWKVELDRRFAEIHSGDVKGIPADEVFAELRKKLS